MSMVLIIFWCFFCFCEPCVDWAFFVDCCIAYFFGTGELLRVFGFVMYIHTYDSYCRNSTNSLSVQLYLFSVTPFSPSHLCQQQQQHHTAAAADGDGNVDATPHAIKERHAVDGSILNVRTQGDNAMRPYKLETRLPICQLWTDRY